MNLSVVVVTWKSRDHLTRLLSSLRPMLNEIEELVVVDNGLSHEGAGEFAEWEVLDWVTPAKNLGFAGGCNRGISLATAPWILLLNPDVVAAAEPLRALYREAHEQPRAAVLCGGLRGVEGEDQRDFQIRPLPTVGAVLRDVLFLDELQALIRPPRGGVGSREKGPVEVEQPAAAFWLLRRSAWADLGGFDEDFYPAWFEDVDFCRRLKERGWKILYYPELSLEHSGGSSVSELGRREFTRIFYRNLLLYWRKHHRFSYPLVWAAVKVGSGLRRFPGVSKSS